MNKLRETEDMLTKKSEFIESQIQDQLALAKKHGMKNKKLALKALKKKRLLEAQQDKIDGTLTTIEFQIEALANAATNAQILNNMKTAAEALKRAHGNKTADDVHEILDELEDANDLANEISDAISRPLGSAAYMCDEDELLAELEDLEQEELDEKMLDIPNNGLTLPDAPVIDPRTTAKDLAALKKWQEQAIAE
ncbi:Oidioi.mRNA.OKI2018_I69.chr2.g8052.t1.cds [Oikopleura dioica]|uniref:Oidioi.mRNA.OKI2018_I69.chr2.g8052.t1.cds n=1 Tax=Oikopleura dioica TaxID=34765 RepID=A0ABN7T932_OIKDI|nr:Oidioi.mRNA.OKI2018_I69.chr2.g8052.t1.cds [Oikopleura dioica]